MQSDYIPTPDEIEAACLAIQSRWTASERRSRLAGVNLASTRYLDDGVDVQQQAQQSLDARLADRRERSSSR